MELENYTRVQEFVLLGFPTAMEFQILLFVIFLVIYILTLLENIVIITLIRTNIHLQKPMYFFLSHLSFLETWYISVTVPKLLVNFLAKNKSISFEGCMAQLYFFISLVCAECVLLAVMAYDRYVAICNPLRYTIIMNARLCLQLAVGSWLIGFLISMLKVFFISRLNLCGPNIINHFFCDISPLLNLSCTDQTVAEMVDFVFALIILIIPLSVTIGSYVCIIGTILRIPTAQGKRKAFSTCASHLTVVVIFYSATLFMYARPRRIHSFNLNKLVSVIYTIVTPMLNPCIYCLRNQDVKEALKKLLRRSGPNIILLLNQIHLKLSYNASESMDYKNKSEVREFILLGFPTTMELQVLLFVVFLIAYILTLLENTIIIIVIKINPLLNKPMYFFLSNLSFLETWYICVIIPKLLVNFLVEKKTISFEGCMTQLYFFSSLLCTECVLLAVMAYDRYVAICNPLRYPTVMTQHLCMQLAVGSWLIGFSASMLKVVFISRLPFCGPNIINHFFCDISPLLNMACEDMTVAEIVDFVVALIVLSVPLSVTIISYLFIIGTILRIPTVRGRKKAFSTCASHLTVVTIYFSTTLFMYARPKRIQPYNLNKLVSVIYTIVTPMLNPFIYCLRNQEVKGALKKALCSRSALPKISVPLTNAEWVR
ncbi:olfactory receptor 1L6-like [Rhineura floridana]|uniref:olfactory receptor 1L6-like n=1 Tax=Rhineura floridana TaxID=261503 RepID=UPI002AC83082|nr:olfactory receptor 1L6-like [Rhineura floridana]